jgi:hypothetical protein
MPSVEIIIDDFTGRPQSEISLETMPTARETAWFR